MGPTSPHHLARLHPVLAKLSQLSPSQLAQPHHLALWDTDCSTCTLNPTSFRACQLRSVTCP